MRKKKCNGKALDRKWSNFVSEKTKMKTKNSGLKKKKSLFFLSNWKSGDKWLVQKFKNARSEVSDSLGLSFIVLRWMCQFQPIRQYTGQEKGTKAECKRANINHI